MELALLMEYGWVLLVLIVLEGLLATDNALVLAIMVRHLPEENRRKALFYGLVGAFLFRFGSLFIISYLVDVWQVQALGAAYLLFMSINHLIRKWAKGKAKEDEEELEKVEKPKKQSSFWITVLKVELADIAFAIDSILAAVALGVTLPELPIADIGGMNGGHFIVILAGGMIGLVIMRFAANMFVKLLDKKPGLEIAAFCIVGWVGVKLLVHTLAHPQLAFISHSFAESSAWKATFYIVLIGIAVAGWFLSKPEGAVKAKKEVVE
ncbi:TerC family protein [Bacillus benzoevorans]|uniref:YkoY family integral membrane protein n=1 Tax=Bacillus benzoevorans TaxID=1456 RepID=A0A7X0LUY6_9BACI|nr:TerC family protein [Bacillus benzoevorans]MBB6445048.1 YkoY family integral membrane protein [Bacillus benzoevorans]